MESGSWEIKLYFHMCSQSKCDNENPSKWFYYTELNEMEKFNLSAYFVANIFKHVTI